jgi:hypothetical protein
MRPSAVPRAAVAAVLALFAAPAAPGEGVPSDVAVKAIYLLKLGPFVEWPSPYRPTFEVCVVGPDPFGSLLDRAAAGVLVRGAPVVVRRMASAAQASDCRIAFVDGSASAIRDAVASLRDKPVLTVTDAAPTPGMVDFVIDQNRVRFRIDDAAAEAAGLKMSSKLLDIAVAVRSRKSIEGGR